MRGEHLDDEKTQPAVMSFKGQFEPLLKSVRGLKRPPPPQSKGRSIARDDTRVSSHANLAATPSTAKHHLLTDSMQNLRHEMAVHSSGMQGRREVDLSRIERLNHQFIELICRELERDGTLDSAFIPSTRESSPPIPAATLPVQAPEQRTEATDQRSLSVVSAQELIEKIEWMLRGHNPCISLKIAGYLSATVEVERLGPREIALRIVGQRGPPDAYQLGKIRDAIEMRGLILRALSVG